MSARVIRLLAPPPEMTPEPQADCDTLDLANQELILRDGRRISLRLQECIILGVLVQACGDFQNKQVLAAAIYGRADRWADTWAAVIQNSINGLRNLLRDLECSFTLVSHAANNDAIGWRLTGRLHVVSRR